MASALTLEDMSPGLRKVVERAQREPEGRPLAPPISSMCPPWNAPITVSVRMRRGAWMGSRRSSTGRTWRRDLQDLHARLKDKRYRHQPIRRVHIPKGQGKTRPI